MFDLDFRIFNIIYNSCRSLGGAFGFSWFEGGIIYVGIIVLGIFKATEKVKK